MIIMIITIIMGMSASACCVTMTAAYQTMMNGRCFDYEVLR